MPFQERDLRFLPLVERAGLSAQLKLLAQAFAHLEKILPSEAIQVGVSHDLLEQIARRLGQARGHDHAQDAVNLWRRQAKIREDLGRNPQAGQLVLPVSLDVAQSVISGGHSQQLQIFPTHPLQGSEAFCRR